MSEHACRSCGSSRLEPILSLGSTPLANRLLTRKQIEEPEPVYPLDLVFCTDCALVQITETVPPEVLFRDYLYFSSFSDTTLQNAENIVNRLIRDKGLGPDSLAVEIASNDGYLLQYYRRKGIPVLGIEPALNIAQVAEERGIRTLPEFFNADLAHNLRDNGMTADVIHANNVLAHVADLNSVIEGFKIFLKPDGHLVIEVPYVKDLIDHVEFDTIYHEHLCYFSSTALARAFQRHGLILMDIELIPIHGGSLRLFAGHKETYEGKETPRRTNLMKNEQAWGVDTLPFYQSFGSKVTGLRNELLSLLGGLKAQNKHIAAYGASAKGSTLLNFFRIGQETIEFVVDRSTVKQGLYTPGAHLPILEPGELLRTMPDYVLLLAWNFAPEILAQQSEYRNRGGKFILPIPAPKVI